MRRSHDDNAGLIAKLMALLIPICLVGCKPYMSQPAFSGLPTHVAGASDAQINAWQTRLTNNGARVISMGQDYLVSIPSSLLFATQSPQLTWGSYQLLNDLVCFLREFRKINVNIRAYSSQYVSRQREHALTEARARAIAEYLWSQDIDTRFIFTQGLGSDKPMGAFKQYSDGSPVSRIEITFRRAVA